MEVEKEANERTIICYGDSNTWGFVPSSQRERFSPDVRWPGALAKLLQNNGYRVVEQGLCGRTSVLDDPIESVMGVEKNGLKLLGTILCSHSPVDLVILMLGTNDLKRRYAATPTDVAYGVGTLVQRARLPEFGPGFISPPDVWVVCPPSIWEVESEFGPIFKGGREKSQEFPKAFGEMAKAYRVPLIYAENFLHSDPSDGIHLSAESHALLAQELARRILERG
ncbi:MAG: SGNH/GDSL hydrolase family protein [Planctomycetota bacterium]|jgi:lysophospholipase L1-like esterase|nr:SGNH/GDSL hydrolase family protein [Planctomycetota bacterium]